MCAVARIIAEGRRDGEKKRNGVAKSSFYTPAQSSHPSEMSRPGGDCFVILVGVFTGCVILGVTISFSALYSVADEDQPSINTLIAKGDVPKIIYSLNPSIPLPPTTNTTNSTSVTPTPPSPIPIPPSPPPTDGIEWTIVAKSLASLPGTAEAQAAGCHLYDLFPSPDIIYPNVVTSPRVVFHASTGTLIVAYLDGVWAKGGALRLMTMLPLVEDTNNKSRPVALPITRCAGNTEWDRVKDPHLLLSGNVAILLAQVDSAADALEGLPPRSALVVFHSEDRGHTWVLRRTLPLSPGSYVIDVAAGPEGGTHLTMLLHNSTTGKCQYMNSVDNGATWHIPHVLDNSQGRQAISVAYSGKVEGVQMVAFGGATHTGVPTDVQNSYMKIVTEYGRVFGSARRALPTRIPAPESANLLDLSGQLNGYLARGVLGEAALKVNSSAFTAKRQLIMKVANNGKVMMAANDINVSPRSERLSMRECEGGTKVRSSCVTDVVEETCVPNRNGLVSSCYRVRAPQNRAILFSSDNDGMTFSPVVNADTRVPLNSTTVQDVPLDLVINNEKEYVGLLLESTLGESAAAALHLTVRPMKVGSTPGTITLATYDARMTGRTAFGHIIGSDARLVVAPHGFYVIAALPASNSSAAIELPLSPSSPQIIDNLAHTEIALISVTV